MRMLFILLFTVIISVSAYSQDTKTTLAVLELQSSGGLTKDEMSTLSNRFRGILVQTNAFIVLEREKMKEILKEQDFIMSDQCNTAECAVQVGQLLGVEQMIAGNIGKIGQTYTIDLRLIDVGTSKILQNQSQNYKGDIDGLLDVMKAIAESFAGVQVGAVNLITKKYGEVYITSAPYKADIYIDGVKTGHRTPKIIDSVLTGKRTIEARFGNYIGRKEIDLKEGAIENVDLKLELITVAVKILSEPENADVLIDNEKRGVTPLVVKLPLGDYSVQVTKTDYLPHTERLKISDDRQTRQVSAKLKKGYKIFISSNINNADVYIDNEFAGSTPVTKLVTEGPHLIRVQTDKSGYGMYLDSVSITESTRIFAELSKKEAEKVVTPAKPVNRKLWYMIGGAAVLGGGTAILLLRNKDKGRMGILPPDLPPDN